GLAVPALCVTVALLVASWHFPGGSIHLSANTDAQPAAPAAPTSTEASTALSSNASTNIGSIPQAQSNSPPVTAVGDSVMLAAVADLEGRIPGIVVDAAVGRQPGQAFAILESLHEEDKLGPMVVLQIGHNGPVAAEDARDLMEALRAVPEVLI